MFEREEFVVEITCPCGAKLSLVGDGMFQAKHICARTVVQFQENHDGCAEAWRAAQDRSGK